MTERKQLYGPDFISDEVFKQERDTHIIKATDHRLDWDKIKFQRLEWDLEIRGLPWQVVRAEYFVDGMDSQKRMLGLGYPLCHCLGGKYGQNNYYAYPLYQEVDYKMRHDEDDPNFPKYIRDDPGPTRHNLIEYDGEAPSWGIVAEGSNYIRKGEIRKGARVYITRNNKKFYEIHSGSVSYGMSKASAILSELQEHPCNFFSREWKKELEGRKVWYDNIPAIAYHVMEDQGCIMLKPDPDVGIPFKPDPYMVDNGEVMEAHYDEKDEIKVDYLYHKINWFRSDADTKTFIELVNRGKNRWLDHLKKLFDNGEIAEKPYYELQKIMFHVF